MNDTDTLFLYVIALATGWGVAYLFKNLGKIWKKLGPIFGFILIPPTVILLMLLADMIRHHDTISLSLTFAVGFLFKLVKRDE